MKNLYLLPAILVILFGCKRDQTTSLPIVTTTDISSLTSVTAISGGNLISDGGEKVFSIGVCWSTGQNPTIEDNKTTDLITFLDGESIAGGKLKETRTLHWLDPNTGATDEVGFKALAGGCRYYAGGFCPIGQDACWWSSTEYDNTFAWEVWTRNTITQINTVHVGKTLANSVRCIRD